MSIDRICINSIDQNEAEYIEIARSIWENPEIGYKEVHASGLYVETLKKHGFQVELGAHGVPTAVKAVWGKGYPSIGFCAEYDALPGLSQKVASHKDPVVPGGAGHGCGHNLLGVGCLAAAIALKEELEATGKEGTIVFYGTPAEELLTGKGIMAKNGAFIDVDVMLAWHPGSVSRISMGSMNGVEGLGVKFHGKTAHAAMNPQDGRSALDAIQLMNMGVEFLREHVTSDIRIHYTITRGGMAPNIVPDLCEGKYMVRGLDREAIVDVMNRVKDCAEGAAKMTGTTVEFVPEGGVYPTMQNRVLAELMQAVKEQLPGIEYTEEELKFADEMNRTNPRFREGIPPIDNRTMPIEYTNNAASSDFGDVMHIVPGVNFTETTSATLSGGHSWMITACAGCSIGFKGMLRAAKTMACGAMAMVDDHSIVEKAKAEFKEAMKGSEYICPMTDDIPMPF